MAVKRDLDERLLVYGATIIKLVESLPSTIAGRRIGDQLLRSGTSVGTNFEEAQGAESKNDFAHKLQIALKELRESNYWLRLLAKTEMLPQETLVVVIGESAQLKAILSKSVATVKGTAKTKGIEK
ncbi:four helix bundle protein [Sulfuriferula plumbiphila]|uniref:Four helix bundle protein n=1 Tax=Sulfuriferula plumbiphila TaxID=171865 RepID=A0A512L7P8_9PROT|nr:four helix bundle protein [Sulfuriferula plumbiphila]BBP03996.1 four helix bundle protein [Sulfuriferula plumbiphila]GEP30487.1 four helix bundle protein [Sulfuriferula plumbiphila]